MNCISKEKGLTLVELAIVLVIVGLLVGIGTSMIGPLTKRAKTLESKEGVNAAFDAVVGFTATNSTLPTLAQFPTIIRSVNDSWKNPYQYILSNNLSPLCGRTTTNITVRQCNNFACGAGNYTDVPNVAFIVLSSGENYLNQTGASQAVNASTTIRTYLPMVPVAGQGYDDIVKWITLDELKTKAACSTNSSSSQLRIINNDIPSGKQAVVYATLAAPVAIIATGGVPNGTQYRWCIENTTGVAPAGLTFAPNLFRTTGNCATLPTRNSWSQATQQAIYGTPTTAGTFNFTVFVRDINDPLPIPPGTGATDNRAQKQFNLMVNPRPTGYRVWNTSGATRDFRANGVCATILNNIEITASGSGYLNQGGQIIRYNSTNATCTTQQVTLNFAQAQTADTDGDGCINLNLAGQTNRVCP